jgi:thymidylate synthase
MSCDSVEIKLFQEREQNDKDWNELYKKDMDEEHEEYQYLNLIRKIIKTGAKKGNRTNVDTYSIFGTQMRFSLRDGDNIHTFLNL